MRSDERRSRTAPPTCATVLFGSWFDSWEMPPFEHEPGSPWMHGGVRALVELAAGIASTGLEVELRGRFLEDEVTKIERATGVRIGRPTNRRQPRAGELVIVPEGHVDPMLFARVAFSPARAVILIQGALGLFGWSFDGVPTPREQDILELDVKSVGRAEQLRAARAFGLELWTNLSALVPQAQSAGVPLHYIGTGRPFPYPEPTGEKQIDVLVLGDNRWGALAREVLAELPPNLKTMVIPRVSHAEMLAAFSLSRVLIHPSRIEGRSRLVEEARAMGAVPVVLSSNTLGEGYGEEYGSVVVDRLAQMAPAVISLLDDPDRVRRLAARGHRTARAIGDWETYRQLLSAAIANPDREVAKLAPGRAQLGHALQAWSGQLAEGYRRVLGAQLAEAEQKFSAAADALRRERATLDSERAMLGAERAMLGSERAALEAQRAALTSGGLSLP